MADVYVVFIKRGSGEVAACFSTAALAMSYIGNSPPCNMQIACCTVDAKVGNVVGDVVDVQTLPVYDVSGVV